MLLLEKLKNAANFTTTEQRVATYIYDNLQTAPTLTIEELAAATYTSHSAIVRLAKKLGYNGFRDLRLALLEAAHEQQQRHADIDANFPFTPADTPLTIAQNLADLSTAAINTTKAQLDEIALKQAADLIAHGQRIFLFALGDSQIRARSFQNKLVKINKFAVIAEEYGDENWTAANITANDCAIFISYGTSDPRYSRIARFLQQKHVPTLLLTGNPTSKLGTLVTHALVLTQAEHDFMKISTFASQVAFEYLLDVLFAIIYANGYQQNLVKLKNEHAFLDE